MPIHIRDTRPVTRKVTTLYRDETLIVRLVPEGIQFREPRRRTWFTLPYGKAYVAALALATENGGLTPRPRRGTRRTAR